MNCCCICTACAERDVLLSVCLICSGGYLCTQNGGEYQGGFECYSSTLFIVNLITNELTALRSTDEDLTAAQRTAWPMARAHHQQFIHQRKLYVIGGSILSFARILSFYDDLHIFDIDSSLWTAVRVYGSRPFPSASASVSLLGSSAFYFGGCGDTVSNSLFQLKLGEGITAEKCKVYGSGLNNATAGVTGYFLIQTTDRINGSNGQPRWGNRITWGIGLTGFSVQLVGKIGSSAVLERGIVTEIGDGAYNVSYTLRYGIIYQVYVWYEEIDVPGSPFTLQLQPAEPTNQFSIITGSGSSKAVKQQIANITVRLFDEFGNAAVPSSNTMNLLIVRPEPFSSSSILLPSIINNNDGSLTVFYAAPNENLFLLHCIYNGRELQSSPLRITVTNTN